MKIKNMSLKVIGIGGMHVMPDQVVEIDDETAKLPAVTAYMELGFIERDRTEEREELEAKIRRETEEKLRAEAAQKAAAEAKRKAKAEAEAKAKAEAEKKAAEAAEESN